jgi:hypothetical protein
LISIKHKLQNYLAKCMRHRIRQHEYTTDQRRKPVVYDIKESDMQYTQKKLHLVHEMNGAIIFTKNVSCT